MTPNKFKQLFGELSPSQVKIINDNEAKYMVVTAGPGSGKTKVLVHKLASLLLMEDVKHEQLLMLTFSRAAAIEFKKRLIKLIGNAALWIDIKTFHSYCFDMLGKKGTIEKSNDIIKNAIDKIKNNDIEVKEVTRTVLVIDEAQDMNEDEYNLINVLMDQNEDMRVIAVGDDDQNTYEFRGASSKYLEQFISLKKATKHELIQNYRSKSNLVLFANHFVENIKHRLKSTPIIPIQNSNGKIKLVHYMNENLIKPLVKDILSTGLSGTTCVLTKTNDEALQVTGLLLNHKINAKLIQSNDGFNLFNLAEIRFFFNQLDIGNNVYIISDDVWLNAKREFSNKFRSSSNFEVCNTLLKDFEETNPKRKYKSDLEIFIRESKIEDFYNGNGETIFVSTIHKAKGKEFDNIFILLENFNASTDEAKRQLYVAMTRAKNNLIFHSNSGLFKKVKLDGLEIIDDQNTYLPLNELVINLTFKDIWLDYFIKRQHLISPLIAGDELIVNNYECLNSNNQSVIKFSKQFINQIESMNQKNYKLKKAKVNFIIYWLKENTETEVKIILPELCFERTETIN